jgi:hypothetical protein
VKDNPVTAAMQAYLRTHPHREDEVEAAFETFDPDAEDSGVEQADALPSDEPAELTATPEQLFDSEAARDAAVEGMARAERAARVQRWKAAAVAWVRDLSTGTEFTADDMVAALGLPDPSAAPAANNVIGAVFSSLSRANLVTFTGAFKTSERVIGHGNLQRIWRRT